MNRINKYFDVGYFFKFVSLVLIFYYFSIAYNGIVSTEGRHYSSFLDTYLNYIAWIRSSILHGSNIIAHIFGTDSLIVGSQLIKIGKTIQVNIWLPCLGLGVISFWVAFVLIHNCNWRKKLIWCISGILAICFINCWRIALLLIALDNNWNESNFVDHHTLFNIVAYSFIIFLMFLYTSNNTKPNSNTRSSVPVVYI
jgi:exosortase/archaeosortase family protein